LDDVELRRRDQFGDVGDGPSDAGRGGSRRRCPARVATPTISTSPTARAMREYGPRAAQILTGCNPDDA